MVVYTYDPATQAYLGPCTPPKGIKGEDLLPAHYTETAPPNFDAQTQSCTWTGSAWTVADLPAPEQPEPLPAQQQLVLSAKDALAASDITVGRCYEHAVPVPAEWVAYRAALRAIVNGSDTTSTALPTMPAYPANT